MSRRREENQPPPLRARTIVRIFLPYLKPQRRGYALALLLALAGTAAGLLKPWPLKYLFDSVLVPVDGERPPDAQTLLLLIVLALAVLTVLDSLIGLLRGYVLNAVGERVSAHVRSDLYRHLQRLPLSYHENTPTGELTNRLTSDVDKVRGVLTVTVVETLTNVLTLVGMASVLLLLDWQLSLGLVMVMPLLVLVVMRFRKRIKAVEEDAREVEGNLASAAQESLAAIKLIKALGQERHESERFAEKSTASMRAILRTARTTAGFSYALDILVAVATAALIWLGAQRVLSGALTPGDLLIFTAYLRDFFGPTRALSKLPAQLTRAGVRAARIADVLRRHPVIVDRPDAVTAESPQTGMRLRGVFFRYVDDEPVLEGIDLDIPVGRTVAVVGPTGAGKSTIAALLCRLQDPVEGGVELDGTDLRDLRLDSLHRQVGLVLQEATLFRASIRENIAYGRPEATDDDVVAAARTAQVHEFVQQLPGGYDTVLAERGATLSGGQRQRLALARAVLHGAPVLVLDEPTTGLDARSEHAVLQSLQEVARDRTTVLITHRMAAAMAADEIVVLDQGVVVERGDHRTLLGAGGLYAEMCRLQKVDGNSAPDSPAVVSAASNGSGHTHAEPRLRLTARRIGASRMTETQGSTTRTPPTAAELLRRSVRRTGGRLVAAEFDEESLIRELEARYPLGGWRTCRRTDSGRSNVSYFVDTEDGAVVLRRCSSLKTVPAARFEAALIDYLVDRGFPAPPVVRTCDGDVLAEVDGQIHMVTRRLPGVAFDKGSDRQVPAAARGLGRYHALVSDLPTDLTARDSSALVGLPERLRDRVPAVSGVVARLLAPADAARLHGDLDYLIADLGTLEWALGAVLPGLTYRIIHGSYGRTALLFEDLGLSGVLDYDRAVHDLLVFDLVYALKSFARPRTPQPDGAWVDLSRARDFVTSYRASFPLPDSDAAALPLAMRAHRIAVVDKKCSNLLAKHQVTPRQAEDAAGFAELVAREAQRVRWVAANEGQLIGAFSAGPAHRSSTTRQES